MIELDEGTRKYFDAIKVNLGYVGHNAGWYSIKEIFEKSNLDESANLELIRSYAGYANSSNIDIYRYNTDGKIRHCAELAYQTNIDDYCFETHIFDKFPSRKDVLTVKQIDEIVFKIRFKRMKTEFNCWECGRKVHWLDSDGNFETKVDRLLDKYCGC